MRPRKLARTTASTRNNDDDDDGDDDGTRTPNVSKQKKAPRVRNRAAAAAASGADGGTERAEVLHVLYAAMCVFDVICVIIAKGGGEEGAIEDGEEGVDQEEGGRPNRERTCSVSEAHEGAPTSGCCCRGQGVDGA